VQCRREISLAPTRYVADRLILRTTPGDDPDPLLDMLRERAAERDLRLDEEQLEPASSRNQEPRPGLALHLASGADGDVWDLLDEVMADADADARRRIGLDHVLAAHRKPGGHPDTGSRQPAHRPGPAPHRSLKEGPTPWIARNGVHRPVIAVVDTGLGKHPWLDGDTVVIRDARVDGHPIGTFTEDEPHGGENAISEYLGHGTFIAGVVHQECPDAAILPVRAMSTDGMVREWDLTRTLERLLEYHLRGVAGRDGYVPVDVVVLAMGFTPEAVADDDYEGVLRGVLRDLRREGVVVVASAGNDGKQLEVFPAAWAPHVRRVGDRAEPIAPGDLHPDYPPVLAVAASDPGGSLAGYSNDGPWVTCVRPGSDVLSTMVLVDGPEKGALISEEPERWTRDPDNYTNGFAVWSGTSFAAPVLAAELAQVLLQRRRKELDRDRVADAWAAVQAVTGLRQPVTAS
jgi:hypothetical protein